MDNYDPYDLSHPSQSSTLLHARPTGDGSTGDILVSAASPVSRRRCGVFKSILTLTSSYLKHFLLPGVTLSYLVLAYLAHTRTIVVDGGTLIDTSPERLVSVKAGMTSISIVVVTLGLWPMKSLIDDIRGEEYFRLLHSKPNGVPLDVVNRIASAGALQIFLGILGRKVSIHLATAFFTTIVVTAVTILAPAALSVVVMAIDSGEVFAFPVGAVVRNSVLNSTYTGQILDDPGRLTSLVMHKTTNAASLAWAESELGVRYSFEPSNITDGEQSILIPKPITLSEGTRARWLSDIIFLNSSCGWLTTNITEPVVRNRNLSDYDILDDNLPIQVNDKEIVMNLPWFGFSSTEPSGLSLLENGQVMVNATTGDPVMGGWAAWMLFTCTSANCIPVGDYIHFNLSDIPHFEIHALDSNLDVALLACSPDITIETREVRNEGSGRLHTFPDVYSRQGNLHDTQTELLFSFILSGVSEADKDLGLVVNMGSKLEASVIFGDQAKSYNRAIPENVTWVPSPLGDITRAYSDLLTSASKAYLDGTLGSSFVPGRTSRDVLVFTTSPPHLFASTVLLITLCMVQILAYFRRGKEETFSLVLVAASLHNSNLPLELSDFLQARLDTKTEKGFNEEAEEEIGDRVVFLSHEETPVVRLR